MDSITEVHKQQNTGFEVTTFHLNHCLKRSGVLRAPAEPSDFPVEERVSFITLRGIFWCEGAVNYGLTNDVQPPPFI